jgi:hypothetical protein
MKKTQYKVIGAGGYGKVFLLPDGTALKAIYDIDVCRGARTEFLKQQKAYNAFQDIRNIEFDNDVLNDYKDKINVSKPISYDEDHSMIEGQQYACHYTMSLLNGLPLTMYDSLDRPSREYISDEFAPNFKVMMHLSLNTDIGGKFYGVKYSSQMITEKNPPRGYFLDADSDVLDKLREYDEYLPTMKEFRMLIGFIYGVLYFKARLVPIDVEITLGYYYEIVEINVLDFGLTIDLDDVKNAPRTPQTASILGYIEKNDIKGLEEEMLYQLSIDLYCDMQEDEDCISGWNIAKEL